MLRFSTIRQCRLLHYSKRHCLVIENSEYLQAQYISKFGEKKSDAYINSAFFSRKVIQIQGYDLKITKNHMVTWSENAIVELLNRMSPKPAFFIVCGDLVDAFPDKWPEIRSEQEKDFFKVFSKLNTDIPLLCVCGNHDVGKLKQN